MALTSTQKAQIRLYLGYPDGWRFINTRLESVLTNLSAEAEVLIGQYLTALAAIEVAIVSGPGSPILSAGVRRVDEIFFFGNDTTGNVGFKSLKDAGKFYAGRLSITVGVPIYSNAFGNGGYLGDSFFGSNGGSNTIPLG